MQQFILNAVNAPNQFVASHHLNEYWALTIMLAELVTLYLFGLLIIAAFRNIPVFFSFVLRKFGVGKGEVPQVFLELTLPINTTKSAFATEQLHILLRGLVQYGGLWDRMAGRKKPYSLEVVGAYNNGIRFVLRIPTYMVDTVRRKLFTYLPGIKIREIDDYLKQISGKAGVIELELMGDFVLLLQDHKALSEHDVMAYLISHMTGLKKQETIAVQIIATPVFDFTHRRVARRLRHFRSRIALGKEISSQLKRQRTPLSRLLWLLWYPPLWFVAAMAKIVTFVARVIAAIVLDLEGSPNNREKRRSDNPYELELMQTVKNKIDQHLFEITIRLLVVSPNPNTIEERLSALVASFQPFATNYQGLRVRRPNPITSNAKGALPRFRARELPRHLLSQPMIVSGSELADLYHFPEPENLTEGAVQSLSRTLPATLSQKRGDNFDVIVGHNIHQEQQTNIGLPAETRLKHTYLIGSTGTGKTTLLESLIYQDMMNGKGLAMLDPHGDMFKKLLAIIPKHREKDVVVFDPSDREFPPGLNILSPGIQFRNKEDAHSWIKSSVISVFSKLTDKAFWGPRMEHILECATLTALQLPNPSLYTLQKLLTDKRFMREAVGKIQDPILKEFWQKEMLPLGDAQLATTVAPLTHRVGKFIVDPMARNILLQPKTTIRLSEIMNEGKILLVNLAKGHLGEDKSAFFGTLLTSLVELAAYQRTHIDEDKRRDFYLYIDEFQNFATPSFADITSEGRKFRIALTVSHQNIAQIEDQNQLKIMAGNAHTFISLRASPNDEAFILPFMEPAVEKGNIVNLSPHHFFMKTVIDESELAFSGVTVPLDIKGSEKVSKSVIASSRKHFATPRADVESYLNSLFTDSSPPPKPGKSSNDHDKIGEQ